MYIIPRRLGNIHNIQQICRRNLISGSISRYNGVKSKILDLLDMGQYNKFALRRSSVFQYEACTDRLNVRSYLNTFELPDTFMSFVLLVQLHVWMCQCRSMHEPAKRGRILRNEILSRMWTDMEYRVTKVTTGINKKPVFQELHYQNQAALCSYDSGLLDDKTMAGALWRTLYMKADVDPRTLELAVMYVRTQMEHLRSIDSAHWCTNGRFDWKPFPPIEPKLINSFKVLTAEDTKYYIKR